jgi:hypothetical protein
MEHISRWESSNSGISTHVDLGFVDTSTSVENQRRNEPLTSRHFAHSGGCRPHLGSVVVVERSTLRKKFTFGVSVASWRVEERNGALVTPFGRPSNGPDLPFPVIALPALQRLRPAQKASRLPLLYQLS